ncbi:hypothetical protein [Persicitalea jodogahamensis]|uniref:Uncharacterized protein n=1 Tax=Persicitalea jodogahamensis TaxID=402147 RepID=A0A8J3GC95_9BACT|nr:hypothetical protein [Persicitalea jodogahamensis]GHB87319.1 hypothetical protein GCM10007390_48930 [Persicitalea jodogahamensis]
MSITPPPKRKGATDQAPSLNIASERKMEEVINRGSTAVASRLSSEKDQPTVKNFNVRIMSDRLNVVNSLRDLRPKKPLSPKPGISLQDWVLEAIEEKIKREQKSLS